MTENANDRNVKVGMERIIAPTIVKRCPEYVPDMIQRTMDAFFSSDAYQQAGRPVQLTLMVRCDWNVLTPHGPEVKLHIDATPLWPYQEIPQEQP